MLTTAMLTTVADIEDAEGVERTQSDERGRTAMTEDASRWVRFVNLRLRMLTSPTPSEGGLHVRAAQPQDGRVVRRARRMGAVRRGAAGGSRDHRPRPRSRVGRAGTRGSSPGWRPR